MLGVFYRVLVRVKCFIECFVRKLWEVVQNCIKINQAYDEIVTFQSLDFYEKDPLVIDNKTV